MAKGICTVEDCGRSIKGRGLCEMHLRRVRKNGEPGPAASTRRLQPEVCIVEGCAEKPVALDLCSKHWQRNRQHGSPTGGAPERSRAPVPERFWSWVDIGEPDECWEWKGGRHPRGYGGFQMHGRLHRAHRVAWELTHGPIATGLEVCHSCDNPPCCNPAHLFLGTHDDNMADMAAKGRNPGTSLPGERNPRAKLTEQQITEIRQAYAAGEGSQAVLAERFGVSRSLIGKIVNRKIWSHLSSDAS